MSGKPLDLFEDQGYVTVQQDTDGRYYIQGKRKKTFILNIANRVFGKLKAIKPSQVKAYADGSNKVIWEFTCECGKTHEASSNQVMAGKTKSCGCNKEKTAIVNSLKSRHKIMKDDAALRSLYSSYKSNAKTRGLEFKLSLDDLKGITSNNCTYCGVSPYKIHKTKHSVYKYNGIDRFDNNDGYTLDNSVACCSICNHAKSNLSTDIFLNWAIDVAEHQKGKLEKEVNREASITNLVMEDLKNREKVGFRKYGRYLTENSDEDMLIEVYEEIQDALLYLKALDVKRQAIYERDKK